MAKRKNPILPAIHLDLITPFSDALARSIEQLYDVFGLDRVSRHLEVCYCPVCMNKETHAQIISTLNFEIPSELICEYSNSAHGETTNVSDLCVLLPRYLELLSKDVSVDYNESNEVLWRIGAARRAENFLTLKQDAALDQWGSLFLQHFAWAEANEMDNLWTAYDATKLLMSGGWRNKHILTALIAAFDHPETGAVATIQFAKMVIHVSRKGLTKFDLKFIFDGGLRANAIEDMTAWLLSDTFSNLLLNTMFTDLTPEQFTKADKLHRRLMALRALS